ALEFMDRNALLLARSYLQIHTPELPESIQAQLLIEVDGNDSDVLLKEMEAISTLLQDMPTGEILFAESHAQKQELWKLRRVVGEAVKAVSAYKEEDTVVPRAKLPELLTKIKLLSIQYGFRAVCYGHAGDGNLHVNILKDDLSDNTWLHQLPHAIRELFEYVKSLGGTLSGEHGIGLVQKPYMDIVFGKEAMQLMRAIKNVFDPKGILNPGKIV